MTQSPALTLARETLDYFRSLTSPYSKDYETAAKALAAIDAELAASADAGRRPYTQEHHFALREAHCVSAGEMFWEARPGTKDAGRMIAFDAGFVRGFDAATQLADERADELAALARPAPAEEPPLVMFRAGTNDIDRNGRQTLSEPVSLVGVGTDKPRDTNPTRSSPSVVRDAMASYPAPVSAQGDERERFESYFADSRRAKHKPTFSRVEDGTYTDDHTQRHWWTWQNALKAARAQVAQGDEVDAEFELHAMVGDDDEYMAASASGPRADALREIAHYAAQYADEGPLEVYEVTRRKIDLPAARAQQGGQR